MVSLLRCPVILFFKYFSFDSLLCQKSLLAFTWSDKTVAAIMKPYNYTMGVVAVLVAGTICPKALTVPLIGNCPRNKSDQLHFGDDRFSLRLLTLASDALKMALPMGIYRGQRAFDGFVVAFITVNIYKVCVKNNA